MFLALVLAVLPAASSPPAPRDAALRRTRADYVGPYGPESLDRWRALFPPTFAALVGERGAWRIQSLMFSYDGE